MGPRNWVTTVVHCARHRRDAATICVRVDREVPEPLRCSPSGDSNGPAPSGPDCACGGRYDAADVARRVAELARRGGLGEWIRRRAVVVEA